jgi:hypothetical protein
MSASISAAKKRRAPTSVSINPGQQQQSQQLQQSQQSQQQAGMTLPQVIALIDSRLIKLETSSSEDNQDLNPEFVQEFENRFDILAEEISNLKQIVLSLQSYTMDVNKMLYEEKLTKDSADKDMLFNVISNTDKDKQTELY